jgi:hypothetical protein
MNTLNTHVMGQQTQQWSKKIPETAEQFVLGVESHTMYRDLAAPFDMKLCS